MLDKLVGKMTKDELIVKQQLEIEELKEVAKENKATCTAAIRELIYVEQWSPKASEFPNVAMMAIVKARDALESV